jgi:hypothetical protein
MALNTSSNLYTGGAVVFNSSPYTNFAINLMAKKQAKDEALESYYQNLNKSINPAGVRTQDVNGFMEKTNGLQTFWQQNKDAIKNPRLDNGRAQTEYNSRYQDIQSYINQSKQEELRKKPFVDMLADPDKRERISDKMLYDVHLHDLPLTDPNRKSFDITQEEFNPKLLSPDELQRFNEGIGKGINPDKNEILTTPDPNDRFSNIETTTTRFSPEKLVAIGNEAKDAYTTNRRLSYTFESNHPFKEWKDEHEQQFNKLNDIHKMVYGTDIKDNEDLYAATILSKKLEPTVTSKKVENWEARDNRNFAQQKELEGIRFAHNKQLAEFRKSLGGDGDGGNDDSLWIDNYIDNLEKSSSGTSVFSEANGSRHNEKVIQLDPAMAKALSRNGVEPDALHITEDGKLRPVFYKYDEGSGARVKNGKYEVDEINSKPLTRQQVKLSLGVKAVSAAQRTKEMASGNSTKQSKTWKHTATGAGGKKAYSDDGINWFDENGKPIK